MALPTWLGFMSILLFNTVDTWFVAQLGEIELAGLSLSYPLIFLMIGLMIGFTVAVSALVSRAVGRESLAPENHTSHEVLDNPRVIATSALWVSAIVFMVFGVGVYFLLDVIFVVLGATEELLIPIRAYMTVWLPLAMPLTAVFLVCDSILRSYGDARTPGILMIAGAVLNALLDPVLIFGTDSIFPGTFAGLGVAGAAWATVISYSLLGLFYIYYFATRLSVFQRISLAAFWCATKELFRVARLSMVESALEPITDFMIFYIIAPFGAAAIAAMGIAYRFFGIAAGPAFALNIVVNPIAGQNFGAGRIDRVNLLWKRILQISLILSVFMGSIFAGAAGLIAGSFTDNLVTLGLAALFMRLVTWTVGGYCAMTSLIGMLYGLDRSREALGIKIFQVVFCYVIPVWVGVKIFGVVGVVYAWALGDVLAGFLALNLYRFWVQPKLLSSTANSA